MNTQPHYQTEGARLSLYASAAQWKGTPFRKGAAIKGAGVDCVNLASELYRESGFDAKFSQRQVKYSLDGGKHCRESKLAIWLQESPRFIRTEHAGAHQIGDLVVFKMRENGVAWHCGVMVAENVFVHAMKPHGVVLANIFDPTWSSRVNAVYRPVERSA